MGGKGQDDQRDSGLSACKGLAKIAADLSARGAKFQTTVPGASTAPSVVTSLTVYRLGPGGAATGGKGGAWFEAVAQARAGSRSNRAQRGRRRRDISRWIPRSIPERGGPPGNR